ncbi:MAG TPA: response regulator [Gemmatimonadales bacterium]|nr:response regulator [Gemmatimonadales bacterium]
MPRARVLLADDNALVATQIQELLEASFDVVGVVSSGEELEAAFEVLAPDVVVADVVMPGEGGLAAVRHIQERHPGTRVVLLSVLDSASVIQLALSVGVQGFVAKEDAADELVPAVMAALEGTPYVSAIGRRVMQ